ncbi:hypothetical protein F5146DRAFT_1133499 [Armillaria mellea]|nr:hypothetical protein F5146DRAFT_1133499 [Armillaria mellea]
MPYRMIPNPYDYEDDLLEFAINYWLCEQEKFNVLAAYIYWDDQPRMILVSSFKWTQNALPDSGDLIESERDEAIAKKWLIDEARPELEELRWITLVDDQRITLNGIQSTMMTIVKSRRDPAEVLEEIREEMRQLELQRPSKATY